MVKVEYGKYDFMLADIVIGVFEVKLGNTGKELSIHLIEQYRDVYGAPIELWRNTDENNVVQDKFVWEYLEDRVAPRTQKGLNELLEAEGITEYDPLQMYACANGASLTDAVWTRFDRKSTFKDVNPHHSLFDVGGKINKSSK